LVLLADHAVARAPRLLRTVRRIAGTLQLDVLSGRLKAEYGLDVGFEQSQYAIARWVRAEDRKTLEDFLGANRSSLAEDLDGDPVLLAGSAFQMGRAKERWEKVEFTDVKDVRKAR